MIAQLLAVFLALSGGAPDSVPTAAVVSFEYRGVAAQDAEILADRFRSELGVRSAYRLLERSKMDDILREQGFQQAGCTSTECAVQTGHLLGVSRMIAGSISHLGSTWSVSAREIDVETGEILRSAVVDLQQDIDQVLVTGMGRLADRLLARKESGSTPSLLSGLRNAFSIYDTASSSPAVAEGGSMDRPTDSVSSEDAIPPIPDGSVPFQMVFAFLPMPSAKCVHGLAVDVGWGRVDQMRGIQAGLVNQVDSALFGIQGGLMNITGKQRGIQGGFFNVAESTHGIQGGVINAAGPLHGMQAGVVNIAEENDGIQVGLVNIWKKNGVVRICPFVGGLF